KVKSLSCLSDEAYAKIKYRENAGLELNLKEPKTFNEKLWWLKLNNRDPKLTECSDKVAVREYVRRCGLASILNSIDGVYERPEDIDFARLRGKYFIKCNHGSGTNVIYDSASAFDR